MMKTRLKSFPTSYPDSGTADCDPDSSQIENSLWTIANVSRYLRVKPSLVKYWLYSTDIPHIKLGRQVRFDPVDVKEWVAERKNGIHEKRTEFRQIT